MAESSNPNKMVVYGLCVVAGAIIGAAGATLVSGGGMGGNDPAVAEYNGRQVRASEALAQVKSQVFELEEQVYRTKEQAVHEFIEQRLLEAEAKKLGVTIDQLLEKQGGSETAEVTDKDIQSFLASKGLSLTDPRIKKDDVREYLKYRQKFDKRQTFVAKLRDAAKVKLLFTEPESPKLVATTEGFPTWGNANAPVTIIEFSDMQCPYCSRAVPTIEQIKKEYGPDKVKIVWRDMPLPSHPRAIFGSLGAHCANDQGKFWEMHNMLFENQTKLEDKDIKEYAGKLSLDAKKFAECYDTKKHMALIEKSRKEAETLGITATPSFVINGSLLQGAQPFPRFKEKIDRIIKK